MLKAGDKLGQILRSIELLRDQVDSWDEYPFSIPVVRDLKVLEFAPGVTFFVGENGSGKSTLIEAIALKVGLNAEGGTRNFNFSARSTESNLHAHLRLARGARRERASFFLRAETMFNVSTQAESYGWDALHEMSHGEAFQYVFMNRFRASGLYILDEPEAALSPTRQLVLLARMHQLVQQQSQFIISTHSPILMAYPGARIYQFGRDGIEQVDYRDTEHYAVTRAFLQDPERMMRDAFASSENDEESG